MGVSVTMSTTGRSRRKPAHQIRVRSHVDTAGAERGQVTDIQRARILSGMFDAVWERGVGSVTVTDVVQRSGVSRRTFYELFDDREECFLAAFDEALARASERVLSAYEASDRWCERIRDSLIALLSFFDDEPVIGHLLICESPMGGEKALERRRGVLTRIIAAIEAGREESEIGLALPPLAGESVVGGILSVLQARMSEVDRGRLVELASPLMSMIAMPYLGSAAAQSELERSVPASPGTREEHAVRRSDPLKDARMRLTYRTVRVLTAIAGSPQISNRVVGEVAGIADQGQISKLLARLQRIGLIANASLEPGQGAPNAWSLTPEGLQVTRAIRMYTDGSSDTDYGRAV